jgi:hypothetical protein
MNRVILGPNGAITVEGSPTAVELWEALRAEYFAAGRRAIVDTDGKRYPQLVNGEMPALLDVWRDAVHRGHSMWLVMDGFRFRQEVNERRGQDRNAPYVDTAGFWRDTARIAAESDAAQLAPSDSVSDSITGGLKRVAKVGARVFGPNVAVASARHVGNAVGGVVDGAAGGLWRLVRLPLAIGAVVVGAVVVVPHLLPRKTP